MPYEIFLALRYLRSRPKRRLARVTALMAILGIAMGVAALIVARALGNGFRDEMRDKSLQGTSHLTVVRSDGAPIEDHVKVTERLRRVDGVVSASVTTYDGALARGTKGSAYAILRGIHVDQSAQINNWLTSGSLGPVFGPSKQDESSIPQAVVGSELAGKLGVLVGDTFEVIAADALANNTRRLRVAGIFRSGLFEYDSTWIYVAFDTATALARSAHAGSVISVQVNDAENVKQIAERVLSTIGDGYTIVD